MSNKFLNLAEEVLKREKVPLTATEIWKKAEKYELIEKLNSNGKTPERSLSANLYVEVKNNSEKSNFFRYSKSPTKFGLKTIKYKEEYEEKSDINVNNFNERKLHPLLTKFVFTNEHFSAYTKTIYHESSKKGTSGKNKWIHPDLVAVHFPYDDYSKETLSLFGSFNETKFKLFSFEMKKEINFSNLREYYFQAVSNSSWANEGYLVTLNIDESDEFLDELRTLNNAFGIGIIKLNAENINESEILLPAKINEKLDWNIIDRLVRENKDFKEFICTINDANQLNKKIVNNFDYIYTDDDEFLKYIEDNKII